jgi:hypothetical protein
MQMIRLLFVLLAAAAGTGQYVQERYRLSVIEKLPGSQARTRYEAGRQRGERGLLVLSIVAGVVGAVALVDLLLGSKLGW